MGLLGGVAVVLLWLFLCIYAGDLSGAPVSEVCAHGNQYGSKQKIGRVLLDICTLFNRYLNQFRIQKLKLTHSQRPPFYANRVPIIGTHTHTHAQRRCARTHELKLRLTFAMFGRRDQQPRGWRAYSKRMRKPRPDLFGMMTFSVA